MFGASRDGVADAHHLPDDPRLPPDLGRDPAALERERPPPARDHDRAQEPARPRHAFAASATRAASRARAPSIAVPIATMSWNAMRTTLTGGRSAGGTASRPFTTACGLWNARIDNPSGIRIPPSHLAVDVDAADVQRRTLGRSRTGPPSRRASPAGVRRRAARPSRPRRSAAARRASRPSSGSRSPTRS